MKSRPHRHHEFEAFGDRRQRRRGGPRVEGVRFHALDVVQIELGDERNVEPDLLAALREALYVSPGCWHVFVFDVAQPPAKNGQPVSIPHRGPPVTTTRSACLDSRGCASAIKKSASRA